MTRASSALRVLLCVCALGSFGRPSGSLAAEGQARVPLGEADIVAIADLLRLEDTRTFDEAILTRLLASPHPEVRRRAVISVGRIVNERGLALLEPLRKDPVPDIVATVAFATGQLKNPAGVPWLTETMNRYAANGPAAFEAARALGKIRGPEARAALAAFLTSAPSSAQSRPVVGEALISMGRFTGREDVAPLVRWASSPDVEVRWRAAWGLFRQRNPDALPTLLKFTSDSSPEVRFWAIRGLAPAVVDELKSATLDRGAASARARALLQDSDRRVRTEAVRTLAAYDDDASVEAVLAQLDNPDTWLSVSAVETLGRHTARREQVEPRLRAATAEARPAALRTVAQQQLTRLTTPPTPPGEGRAGRAGRAGGAGGAGRASGAGGAGGAGIEARPAAEYRALVERWIVPAYNGAPKPRAVFSTEKGEMEVEFFAADAPFGMEEFVRLAESGAIVGTVFTRVVPNFVLQQAGIKGANRLRDEVSRHGLTRANLSWASAGLDTGRPGYTFGHTPQPHNEGDFTALGRIVRGMDVVDRVELGDTITAIRIR